MREKRRLRWGRDLRTHKKVIIIGEAAGLKLFAGNDNLTPSPARRRKKARDLIQVCHRHGVLPQQLALALIGLGHEVLWRLAKR